MPDSRDFASILLKRGYTGIKKVGEGSFGVAVLVKEQDGTSVICKLVDVSRASKKETSDARRESQLLAQLKHPYIVRYRDNFHDRGWLAVVMDYCDGGDVTARIDEAKKAHKRLEEELVMRWVTQATLALKYLHGKHILHRDLKPSNLFLTTSNDLRMGDFGISKVLPSTIAFARSFVGTPYYLSPEVIQGEPYAYPADIWSLGCILYQLCALVVPWDAANIKELSKKITTARIPQVPSLTYSEDVRSLCRDMMIRTASERPNADGVIGYPIVQAVVRALMAEVKADEPQEETVKVRREVLQQFQQFDKNLDGCIDRAELGEVLRHLDAEVWTDVKIDQVLKLADTNGDGKIQLDEFVHWMFGSDADGAELAARLQETVSLANKAVDDDDLETLRATLVSFRQAVDLGCLRVSPPETSRKTCEALTWLALSSRTLLQEASDSKAALMAVHQMRAILLAIRQLLLDCRRRRLRRVAEVSSRVAVKGVCFELADGGRLGILSPPDRLTDVVLQGLGARWQLLEHGEYIVRIYGQEAAAASGSRRPSADVAAAPAGRRRSRSSSPAPAPAPAPAAAPARAESVVCAGLVLCTSKGRQLELGGRLAPGTKPSFDFTAREGEEIVEVLFQDGKCKGVRGIAVPCSWSDDNVANVQASFQSAVEGVWPLLIDLSRRQGEKQSRFASLQAKRLGLAIDAPEDEKEEVAAELPEHWDVVGMGEETAIKVRLGNSAKTVLQAVMDLAYNRFPSRDPPSAFMPLNLELVDAYRLQNKRAWRAFNATQASLERELEASGVAIKELCDPTLVSQLESIGVKLNKAANSAWLFHGISSAAAEDISSSSFDISVAGAEERAGLYGHGVYFTEFCDKVDKLSGDGGGAAGNVHSMLLCRVALGNALSSDEILPDVVNLVSQCTGDGPYHSVLGDRSERCPGVSRQFVVYDKDQVYPEILLQYRRVYR